jgi:hypothetical protein
MIKIDITIKIKMKIAILFVLLLTATCAQNVCKVFSCGSISQTEGEEEICVKIQTGNADVIYDSATCSKNGEYCLAWEWGSVSEVEDSARCGTVQYENIWPIQFFATANKGLDGDICETTADCYKSPENAATCESKVCISSIAAGGVCAVTNDCPVSHWCTGDSPVCTVHTDDGETCSNVSECGYRRDCIEIVTNGTAAAATCVVWGSLANGDQFTQTITGASGEFNAGLAGSDVCKSGRQVTIDGTMQCRSADRNKVQGRAYLKKDTAGEECVFDQYRADTLAEFDTPVEGKDFALCGFNKDNKAWCPLLLGDDEVLDIISDFNIVWDAAKCHKNSGAPGSGSGSVCKAQFDIQDLNEGWRFFHYIIQTATPFAFANSAYNDQCVADTIMSNFWHGRFDSAYAASAFTSMFVLIASFIY